MSGRRYFLDTNIVVPFLNGEHLIIDNVNQLTTISLPIIVLGELYYGAMKSARSEENVQKIKSFSSQCQIYTIDETIVESYGIIKATLVKQGTPIPENDIWIAALSKEYDLPLVTRDKHFKNIPDLQTVEW